MENSNALYRRLQPILGLPDRCTSMRLELNADSVPTVTCRHYPDTRPEPKLQISPDFKWCSDVFRRDFNDWLRRRFGERDPLVEVLTTYELVERSDEASNATRVPGGS